MKKIVGISVFLVGGVLVAFLVFAYIWGAGQQVSPVARVVPMSTGVTNDTIVIGTSLPLSGLTSVIGSQYEIGERVYVNRVNDEGGIYGRKIELKVYDDAYIPARTILNVQKMVNRDHVFAFLNFFGSSNGAKIAPILSETKIPLVGIYSGAQVIRNPLNRYIFNVRTSYYEETEAFIRGAVDEMGMTKIAIFYQNDDFGLDGKKGVEIALSKRGLKPAATGIYTRGQMDVEEAVKNIKDSGAEAVAMIATYSQAAKFIELSRKENFHPLFLCLSVVGPGEFARLVGGNGNGVVVAGITPPPFTMSDTRYTSSSDNIINEYAYYLHKYYGDTSSTFDGLSGYINAKVLGEGLRLAGSEPTREKLVVALESVKNMDLGIPSSVSFSAFDHQGLNKVFLTYLYNGTYNQIEDLERYKQEVLNRTTTKR